MKKNERSGEPIARRYRLTQKLSDTALGERYLATHTDYGREMEIELVSGELVAADPSFEPRFSKHVGALAGVMHPGIAMVHDFGRAPSGELYIVSARFAGRTLAEVLADQPTFPTEQAASIALAIGRALRHAHNNGVVHGALDADNVVLEPEQNGEIRPVLKQLGLAQLAEGTDRPDVRGDVRALGAILDHMLPEGVARPAKLDAVVERAIDDRAEGRYDAMLPMVAALEMFLAQRRARTLTPPPPVITENNALPSREQQVDEDATEISNVPAALAEAMLEPPPAIVSPDPPAPAVLPEFVADLIVPAPIPPIPPIPPVPPVQPVATDELVAEELMVREDPAESPPAPVLRAPRPRSESSVIAEIARKQKPAFALLAALAMAAVAAVMLVEGRSAAEARIETTIEAPQPAPDPLPPFKRP